MSVLLGGLLIITIFGLIILVLFGGLIAVAGFAILFSPFLFVVFAVIIQIAIIVCLFIEGDSYSPIHTLKKVKWRNRSPHKPQVPNYGWPLAAVSGVVSTAAVLLLVFIPFFMPYTSQIVWGVTIVAATSPLLFSIGLTIDERAIRQYKRDGGDISVIKSSILEGLLHWNLEIEYTNLGSIVSYYVMSLLTGNTLPIIYVVTRTLILGTGIGKQFKEYN